MRQRLRLLLYALALNAPNIGLALRQVGWRQRKAKKGEAPRLLFYAINGVGLGHATRLLGIARCVRRLQPRAEILFVTSSEAAHLLYREGFAVVKTPSHSVADKGLLPEKAVLRLNHFGVWSAILAFDPHCLIVDSFPSGIQDELLPFLHKSLQKVFVFRAQRAEQANNELQQNILQKYDLILVPHAPASETVPTPPDVKTVWTGPMIAFGRDEMLPREEARAALGLPPNGFMCLITLGGGGEDELNRARQQLSEAIAQLEQDILFVEVVGPLERSTPNIEFRNRRVLREVHPLMRYLNAFDGAISAVGYNTTQELQAAQIPTIFWPFPRQLDDQNARARRLADAGRALCIGEGADENQIAELTKALRALMQPQTREHMRAAMQANHDEHNGAAVGAAEILKHLRF